MSKPISLCYHPTKIVFVDDSRYMKKIVFKLSKDYAFCCFTSTAKALDFFSNYNLTSFVVRASVAPIYDELRDNQYDRISFLDINIALIRHELNPQRFEEVAIAVVDYAMPGKMTGLDLSRKMRALSPNLKIILLTGEASHELAIQAFNHGLIDFFIKKSTDNLTDVLLQTIKNAEHYYFRDLSKPIINRINDLEIEERNKLLRLNEPILIDIFNEFCVKQKIIEYYILNDSANYLLLDKEGHSYWFGLYDEAEMQVFDDILNDIESGAVYSQIVEPIIHRKAIPIFFKDEKIRPAPEEWLPYIHQASQFKGLHDTYYYAFVDKTNAFYSQYHDEIFSYENYLDKNFNPE